MIIFDIFIYYFYNDERNPDFLKVNKTYNKTI